MSLLRQLLVSVSVAVFVILIGVVWLSTQSAREYLNTQLQIQADSAVTSLALTLSQPANQDEITRELIVAAVFDTGQFSRIAFKDPEGQLEVERLATRLDIRGVPNWFVQYADIETARAAAQVSDGWTQVGQVLVQADPSYAYHSLWNSFLRLVGWVAAAGILWAVFVLFLIRWLRRVLHIEVAQRLNTLAQADSTGAIVLPSEGMPTFVELREVAQALDSARQSILATAEERQMKIESLELELNQDSVTLLANRKYFINELRQRLEKGQRGWLLIARLRDLAEINRSLSRPLVDDWLLSMGQQLHARVIELLGEQAVLARLNGSDFVVLLDDLPVNELRRITQLLRDELLQQRIQLGSGAFCRWAFAQTNFQDDESFSQVLARLDQALMRSESAGHEQIEILTADDSGLAQAFLTKGETQWRERLEKALQQGQFSLAVQRHKERASWHEATLMLADDGQNLLSAFQFMPVAARVGLSGACDLQAIKLALQWLQENDSCLVVRVSLPSLSQTALLDHMTAVLQREEYRQVANRLYIELDAYALDAALPAVQRFVDKLRPYGVNLGVRRVLQLPQVVLEFRALGVRYVKLDADMLAAMSSRCSGMKFIKALWDISQQADTAWFLEQGQQTENTPLIRLLRENGIYFK